MIVLASNLKVHSMWFHASPKMESFILLFLIVSCHLNQFKITNETTSTMHNFILKVL
jgi:hypothetical protein